MKVEDFVRNLRGIDDGHDVDLDMLVGIYDRIRSQEFRPGGDHVTQVLKVQQTIVSKCPNLAVPYRRLVCYCRLYEVHDPYKKERPGKSDFLVVSTISLTGSRFATGLSVLRSFSLRGASTYSHWRPFHCCHSSQRSV